MSEEQKIRGGVTPELNDAVLDEKKLEKVTGGDAGDDWIAFNRMKDCDTCSNAKTDACPYRDNMNAYYYDASKDCPARS